MDLNGDGHVDILSGSYSRMDAEMAGLFQVLNGKGNGQFAPAKPMTFDGEEPLVVTCAPESQMGMPNAICTRPFAADLDGDGVLDLVVGDFEGMFAFVEGLGDGAFAEEPIYLKDTDGKALQVAQHSDPFLIDWDGDGDLDLLSGSAGGDVSMFRNVGSKTEPSFAAATILFKGKGHSYEPNAELVLGDEHIKGPQHSVRIAAADVNQDGKLDLLIGDQFSLAYAVEGVSEEDLKKRLAAWRKEMDALQGEMPDVTWPEDPDGEMSEEDQAAMDAFYEKMNALQTKRAEFIREEATGSVWLLKQK